MTGAPAALSPRAVLASPKLLALWLLVRVFGRLPAGVLGVAADVVGTLAWFARPGVRETTRDHMRHVLGPLARPDEVDRAARGCARAASRYWADFARGPHQVRNARPIDEVEGLQHALDAYRAGRGLILLSAHLGNPEAMARAASELGLDLVILTQPLSPPALHRFVHVVRAEAAPGVRFVPADLAGLRLAYEHLRHGGALGVLADRDVLDTGVPQTFFGERALLPGGIAELAVRTGAAVVSGFALRTRGGRFRAVLEPPLELPRDGDREADVEEARRRIVAALERGIRRAPEQWFPLDPVWSGLAR